MTVRLNRIYTKSGDKGMTRLSRGVEISKGSLQVESYGMMDEVNSHLGVIRSWAIYQHTDSHPEIAEETEKTFEAIQNIMFDIGRILARPIIDEDNKATPEDYDSSKDERVLFLEERIDTYRTEFDAVSSFTIPGGCMLNAYAHVARTTCRRWERIIVRRREEMPTEDWILVYINRLSDYLYAYSRWVSNRLSDAELLWKPGVEK
ncbi:MAG: cob(I)yrinic acid a,c-diamide adenosyltransferase [Pirellulales bacterium]|nr:cob(I)yrinic acid a,c-diamide adenosyltransferase [Pirellulales bacterium]